MAVDPDTGSLARFDTPDQEVATVLAHVGDLDSRVHLAKPQSAEPEAQRYLQAEVAADDSWSTACFPGNLGKTLHADAAY